MATILLIIYFISSLLESFVFHLNGIDFKPVYIASLLFFMASFLIFKYKSPNQVISKKTYVLFIVLLAFLLFNLFISIDKMQTAKLILVLFLNIFISTGILMVGNQLNINKIERMLYYSVLIFSSLCLCQFILSVLGMYEPYKYGIEGYFNLGRPTGTLIDPGWCSVFTIGVLGVYTQLWQREKCSNKNFVYFNIFCFCISLLGLSRLGLILVFTNYLYVSKYSVKIKTFLVILSIVIISLIIPIANERFFYDIFELSRNPRITDYEIVIDAIIEHNKWLTGFGIGTVITLNDIYPWRNFGANHNLFFISVLFESGIVGVVFVGIVIIKLLLAMKSDYAKFQFAQLVTINFFHNSINKQFLWIIIALMIFLDTINIKDNSNV